MTTRQPTITQRFARSMARTPQRAALRIAIIYTIFGCAWILFSDVAVGAIFPHDFVHRFRIQTLKGWLFIVVTAAMLYVLIRRAFSVIRHSERARRDIENQTRLLVERVRDYAIFTLDAAGNVTSWNRGAQQIFDWREEDVIGKHYAVFYNEVDVQAGKPQHDLEAAATEGWDEQEIVRRAAGRLALLGAGDADRRARRRGWRQRHHHRLPRRHPRHHGAPPLRRKRCGR